MPKIKPSEVPKVRTFRNRHVAIKFQKEGQRVVYIESAVRSGKKVYYLLNEDEVLDLC